MKPKQFISWLLLAFVAASVAVLVIKQVRQVEPVQEVIPENTELIAYYFHTNFRCPTCNNIENYSRETVQESFAKDMESERLIWRAVNLDKAGNEHFAKDYEIVRSSLVLVEHDKGGKGKWKNLDQVWELVGNKVVFQDYIRKEVRAILK